MTSVSSLMQICSSIWFRTASNGWKNYIFACELYMEQPEGFEVTPATGEKLFCKLNTSLYGLKQSGQNWNKMLRDFQ